MIKKRYISLGILFFVLYALFVYEPNVDESEVKTFLSIKASDKNQKVDISLTDAVAINVDGQNANINVGDEIKINAGEHGAKTNVLGIGDEIENSNNKESESNTGALVSVSTGNPMGVSAGNVIVSDDAVHIDGTGVGEAYVLDGQDLFVNGVKNHIKIDGKCGDVDVNGVAMIVRIENATKVTINGVGNRVYLADDLSKDLKKTNGLLNFIFQD